MQKRCYNSINSERVPGMLHYFFMSASKFHILYIHVIVHDGYHWQRLFNNINAGRIDSEDKSKDRYSEFEFPTYIYTSIRDKHLFMLVFWTWAYFISIKSILLVWWYFIHPCISLKEKPYYPRQRQDIHVKMMSTPENIIEMGKVAWAEQDKAMATHKQLLSFQKKKQHYFDFFQKLLNNKNMDTFLMYKIKKLWNVLVFL